VLTVKLKPTTVAPSLALERALGRDVRVVLGKVLIPARDGWQRRLDAVLKAMTGGAKPKAATGAGRW
jgi:hypothetical protein